MFAAASRASFLKDSLDKVCDVDLVYDTAILKVNFLKEKDEVYSKLSNFNNFSITQNEDLEQWLNRLKSSGKNIDLQLLEKIKEQNKLFFNDLEDLILLNSTKSKNEILNTKARDIEDNSQKLFDNLNEIKKIACK